MTAGLGDNFALWFDAFLPRAAVQQPATLFTPATVSDRSDGKIAHLDGLNLSRAWSWRAIAARSEEHTSELQSLMRISYAVLCLKKTTKKANTDTASTPTQSTYRHKITENTIRSKHNT